ncbi:hypothetical protein [Burkholderia sp. BCC0405]|uniref:hypothetical protein n=1 Tax=Burkholderia sp. BCC0405 TaxID=2676298 RepID=UPI00158D6FF1|nr:hypothetical protein [Burkholderia sp. BCC0405]
MKKYRASWKYAPRIEEFEVEKETKLTVSYNPWRHGRDRISRENKTSDGHGWFDTFDEAKSALVVEFERKVERARDKLKRANDALGNANGIKEPMEPL